MTPKKSGAPEALAAFVETLEEEPATLLDALEAWFRTRQHQPDATLALTVDEVRGLLLQCQAEHQAATALTKQLDAARRAYHDRLREGGRDVRTGAALAAAAELGLGNETPERGAPPKYPATEVLLAYYVALVDECKKQEKSFHAAETAEAVCAMRAVQEKFGFPSAEATLRCLARARRRALDPSDALYKQLVGKWIPRQWFEKPLPDPTKLS